MRGRRAWAAAVLVALTATTVTACDLPGGSSRSSTPAPTAYVARLASALGSGTLGEVAFANGTGLDATAALSKITDHLDGATAQVTGAAGDVAEATGSEPATGSVTLSWTWDVAGHPWSYSTTAPLTYDATEKRWEAEWAPTLVEPSLLEGSYLDAVTQPTTRGAITGAGGEGLVVERKVVRFGIDRTLVDPAQAGASATALADLLGIDAAGFRAAVEAAGPKAFVEAITLRQEDVSVRVARKFQKITGARGISTTAALGPNPDFAVPILGRVGPVTAEMVQEHPDRYRPGDVAGLSGLEARYDEQLTGTPGVVVNAVASDGGEQEVFRVDAVDGEPLALTLDLEAQLRAERALSGVGPAAALVAIRPSDGAILAAANGPGAGGINLATYGQAAPGSTFKLVSSLALLRAGLTPDSPVDCPATIVVDGKSFENYDDYPPGRLGRITLRTAIAHSCNTAMISAGATLGDAAVSEAAASLGLGIDHDLGFPAYFGQAQPATAKTEKAAQLIGQGTILASPMAMAAVIASIQAGRTVVPQLITTVPSEAPAEAAPLMPGEATALRRLLRAVVTDGSGAGLLDVPGPPVIAKTGTAEFDQDGKRLLHAWMVAAQGDLAVAVYVDEGSSGSRTAGPILEAFLRG